MVVTQYHNKNTKKKRKTTDRHVQNKTMGVTPFYPLSLTVVQTRSPVAK